MIVAAQPAATESIPGTLRSQSRELQSAQRAPAARRLLAQSSQHGRGVVRSRRDGRRWALPNLLFRPSLATLARPRLAEARGRIVSRACAPPFASWQGGPFRLALAAPSSQPAARQTLTRHPPHLAIPASLSVRWPTDSPTPRPSRSRPSRPCAKSSSHVPYRERPSTPCSTLGQARQTKTTSGPRFSPSRSSPRVRPLLELPP